MMRKLNEYYRTQSRPPVAEDPVDLEPDQRTGGEGGHDTPPLGADCRASPAPKEGIGIGFGSTSIVNRAAPTCTDNKTPSEIVKYLRGPVLASTRPPRPPSAGVGRQQTSMATFVVDELQKKFDQAIASFYFKNDIPFNAARSDSYKNMERIMSEAARSPRYNFLRTKALPTECKTVDGDLEKIREPWDITSLKLMTDSTTTTSDRAVMNFIAAGDSGAVMVKSVDMEGKDKSAPALEKMWEEVIRELGVHRVNAICTDLAQVNISARKTTTRRLGGFLGCHVHAIHGSGDVFSTPDKGLQLGKRFASLLPHMAPIAPRGSAQDFCKHLASMSPMRTDDESNTPDWARFTEPTPPTLRLNEDIRLVVGEGTCAQVLQEKDPASPGWWNDPTA
ncbi:hypothetical protein CBR_g23927 [Chara braunii]|uniref:DUF659 domain-containing protein n=1 Tax=Chara braunii TaxID=69332 RepID=A0A388L597_CHABU|nr:hypothetical protein CBR_g23927 [Chara braunii]|eukprot:GBG77481.1 hypothetical protein CBR_g23927 [Chara braunii]